MNNRMYGNQQMQCQNRMMRQGQCCSEEKKMSNRFGNDSMSCKAESEPTCPSEIPTASKKQLLNYINEVSFAVYETLLYLDTHPEDTEAMCFFQTNLKLRKRAMKEYAKQYGPLTIANTADCASASWEWMNQPWPWEGGDC